LAAFQQCLDAFKFSSSQPIGCASFLVNKAYGQYYSISNKRIKTACSLTGGLAVQVLLSGLYSKIALGLSPFRCKLLKKAEVLFLGRKWAELALVAWGCRLETHYM
jgi:hypothetical protein